MSEQSEIQRLEPEGPVMIPQEPVSIPRPKPVDVKTEFPAIQDSVNFLDLIKEWVRTMLSITIINFKEKPMDSDIKTTASAIGTGIVALVGLFGLHLPVETVIGIVSVGIMVIGYFAKDKAPKAPEAPKPEAK